MNNNNKDLQSSSDANGRIDGTGSSLSGSTGHITSNGSTIDGSKISASTKIPGSPKEHIKGEGTAGTIPVKETLHLTRKERIALSTKDKGLKEIPQNFGESNGDWQVIESDQYFELLYIDSKNHKDITPELVQNNYKIIKAFWEEKKNYWESGSSQIRENIERRYNKKNLENCLSKLDEAYNQLNSSEKIYEYTIKIEIERLEKAKSSLSVEFNKLVRDGDLSDTDFETLLEMKNEIDLSDNEIKGVLLELLKGKELFPVKYQKGKGWIKENVYLLKENPDKIVEYRWMTDVKLQNQIPVEAKEILDGQFAESVEEIGEMLYSNEEQARKYINKNLLHNSVSSLSPPKALVISEICESKDKEYIKYLKVVYTLNRKLPYRFNNKEYLTIKSLVSALFEDEKNGKEHVKQGYIEVWLKESQKENYDKFIKIRDKAENANLAFLEFIYSFNSELPYRFNNNILVHSPIELCAEIDKNADNWSAGKSELFSKSILTWLASSGETRIVEIWNKIKDEYKDNEDLELESFLHLLDNELPNPQIELNKASFSFPAIQSGDVTEGTFIVSNKTRGYVSFSISTISKKHDLIVLSNDGKLNNAIGQTEQKIDFFILSASAEKDVFNASEIIISASNNQKVILPINYKVVFPKREFLKRITVYAGLFAIIGIIIRGIMYVFGFTNWLKIRYANYISIEDIDMLSKKEFASFGFLSLILLAVMLLLILNWKKITDFVNEI